MGKHKKSIKYYSPKRRAIYQKGEKINCLEIFERDQWICQICFIKIDRRIRYPSWKCATLDHRVPISVCLQRKWPVEKIHTKDNLVTAHLKCNLDKGNVCMTTVT